MECRGRKGGDERRRKMEEQWLEVSRDKVRVPLQLLREPGHAGPLTLGLYPFPPSVEQRPGAAAQSAGNGVPGTRVSLQEHREFRDDSRGTRAGTRAFPSHGGDGALGVLAGHGSARPATVGVGMGRVGVRVASRRRPVGRRRRAGADRDGGHLGQRRQWRGTRREGSAARPRRGRDTLRLHDFEVFFPVCQLCRLLSSCSSSRW